MARHRARLGRILFATGLLVPAVVLLGAPVYAEGEANSGSIKIAQVDDGTHPGNDPHQESCVFRVDFYGFRAGTYHVAVALHPPTGNRVLLTDSVTIDEKAKTSGSSKSKSDSKSKSSSSDDEDRRTTHKGKVSRDGHGDDDDEGDDDRRERTYKANTSSSVKGSTYQTSRTYDVSTHVAGSERHSQHGYHLRVDVKRDGHSGSGSKTKVFWLNCGPNGGVSGDDDDEDTGGGATEDGGSTGGGSTGGGTTDGSEVLGEQTTRAQTATAPTRAEVLGMQVFRPAPGEVPAGVGSRLASTGVSTYLLLALGAAMVLASFALARDNLLAARKRRT